MILKHNWKKIEPIVVQDVKLQRWECVECRCYLFSTKEGLIHADMEYCIKFFKHYSDCVCSKIGHLSCDEIKMLKLMM